MEYTNITLWGENVLEETGEHDLRELRAMFPFPTDLPADDQEVRDGLV